MASVPDVREIPTIDLLHQLLHKVSFNGDLIPFYAEADIERQVRDIVEACFPEIPRAIGE